MLLDTSVRERWNDYGIGLLLQGDLKGAEAAFLKVTEMEPGYADGWVNVGRARLQEGNMAAAEEIAAARRCSVDPKLAKTHFFLGIVLKTLGRYDEAIEHLRTRGGACTRAIASCSTSSAASCSCSASSTAAVAAFAAGARRSIRRICRRTTT